jgi:hypothetical protein
MIKLLVENIENEPTRENFKDLNIELAKNPFLAGNWVFREYTFTQAETGKLFPHGLSFTPKDVIQTSITGAGALTINYGSFTGTDISLTTTGACVVRLLIGRFGL